MIVNQDSKSLKNPFYIYSEFISKDNRINRVVNPITAEVLTKKHNAILPPDFIRNKTVLDLGSQRSKSKRS